ncbi:proline dehydrogenase family protein [Marivirga arenosa]|uniref:Proline dehydrogenase family protein n=1 Tax=Marivirga arenosa TaxID=3059076 RepID=A0AA51ZXJ7_9BACT|nr:MULTISPECIES: proline dehydrogenase family protein [unclassified Marivirga]WMN07180.1 proline dehydrogenase family protein [Marivirga sp. ABR2-2]WNB18618.1 proline dehydrogenase family protein [Marivirga sp. BKB1-2]
MEVTTNPIFDDVSIAYTSKSDRQLKKAYLLFAMMNKGWLVAIGKFFVKLGFALHLPISKIIYWTVYDQFCGGVTIKDSQGTIDELASHKIGTILDYSVEGAKNEKGFDKTMNEILRTIDRAADDDNIPFCVFKPSGVALGKIFTKIQAGKELTEKEKEIDKRSRERIEKLCKAAYDKNVRLLIDAEESWLQDPIDELVYEMMEKYNKDSAIIYNTYQMYRADMFDNLKKAHKRAKERGYFIGAKLVRGAYMEKEADRAEEMGYPNPIQISKERTDIDYNSALEYCVENLNEIAVFNGTHNQYSNYFLAYMMNKHGIEPGDQRVHFAQLYGMSDNISFNLADKGYNVAKYVPYGPVKSVMPYLFRRAEENTSVAGQSSREFSLLKEEMQRRKEERKNK